MLLPRADTKEAPMKRTIFLLPMLGLLACSGSETEQNNAAMGVYAAAQDAVENGICACAQARAEGGIMPPGTEIPPPEEPPVMPPKEPPPPCENPDDASCEIPEEPPLLPCDDPEQPCEPPVEPPLPCEGPEKPPLPCEGPEEPPLPCEGPEKPPLPCEFPEEPVAPPCELPPPPPIEPVDCPCAEAPLPPCEAAFVGCIENGKDPGMDCGAVLVECLGPEVPEAPGTMDCPGMREECQKTIGDAGLCEAEFDLCRCMGPVPPPEMPVEDPK